jgi:hypothetical protein
LPWRGELASEPVKLTERCGNYADTRFDRRDAARRDSRALRRCARRYREIDPIWLARCNEARRQSGNRHGAHRACGKGDRVGDDTSVTLDVTRPSASKSAPIGPHLAYMLAVPAPALKPLTGCSLRCYTRRSSGDEPAPVLAILSSLARARAGACSHRRGIDCLALRDRCRRRPTFVHAARKRPQGGSA